MIASGTGGYRSLPAAAAKMAQPLPGAWSNGEGSSSGFWDNGKTYLSSNFHSAQAGETASP